MISTSSDAASLILCIDDADIALRIRKLLLASVGYRVLTAHTGEDGFELFQRNAIELVVADHFLTDATGSEIAQRHRPGRRHQRLFCRSRTEWLFALRHDAVPRV